MCRKRKASSPASTENPRKKRGETTYIIPSSEDEEESEDSGLDDNEWYINCILAETESKYLIDWEGPWSPTWEPKEHANEIAVQVWEEEKKKRKKNRNTQGNNQLAQTPPTQSAGPVECEADPPRAETGPASPLFVPFEGILDLEQAEDYNKFSRTRANLKQLTSRTQVSNSRRGELANNKTSLSISTPHHTASVFEYISKSPVPSEYRLPGEFTVPNSPTPQVTDSSRRILFALTADDVPSPNDALNSERIRESRRSNSSVTHSAQRPSEIRADNPHNQVDEIAETPSRSSDVLESQSTGIPSGGKNSHPQFSILSNSYQSNSSSLVSQVYPSSGTWSAGQFLVSSSPIISKGSVPESVAATTSQSSTHSYTQILNIQSSSVHQSYLASQIAGVTMDDNNQKEAPSLAETMEKYSQFEGSTPREKLRNAYAQLRAKTNSGTFQNADASATPSSAGDIEPSAPFSVPETIAPLSVRVDKEPPSHSAHTEVNPITSEPTVAPTEMEPPQQPALQTIQPSALTVSHHEAATPGSAHLGPSEFAVPLPMDSRVKDDYEQVLRDEAQSIREFLSSFHPQADMPGSERERLIPKMHGILEHLSNVSTHPDLNIADHIKDSDSDLGKEAAWAEYSSAKFLFLGYLVDLASNHDLHLVVMVHGAKTLKIVEHYFQGKGLAYTRPRQEMGSGTNLEVSMVKGSLSFGIQSSQNDGIMEVYRPPSAIITLDTSFNAKSPSVEHMRTTYARNGNLLPVIRLFVSNSSEHIELCFPNFPEPQRLRLLIQYTARLRDTVGDLQDDALGVHEDAEEVLSSLLSDNFNAHWPLPLIEPLHIVTSDELDSILIGSQSQAGIDIAASQTPPIPKRLFQVDDAGEQSPKRQRMDVSQDPSQFTEFSKFPSQTLDNDLQTLERNLMQLKNSHAAELEKLQKALANTQSRLEEREKILATLQHRYESRTQDLHKVRQERDRLAENKLVAEQRVEKQKEDITKLKDERTQLKQDLEKAREALKAGGGSVAELESAQEEIRRLTKENASLERKAEYEGKQAEYTREQYQTASTIAAQSGNEIRQLKEENESLTRKVAGDASRLRELNLKSDEARHLSRVTELEAMLASRDDLLRKKEEELRELRKNRPSTRSTSTQPRSPKWNAGNSRPTSPGINNNNGSRGSALRFSSEMTF